MNQRNHPTSQHLNQTNPNTRHIDIHISDGFPLRNQPTRRLGGTITYIQNGIGSAAQTKVDMDQWDRACVDKWISTKEEVLDVAADHCSIVHGCVHGGYL
nr:hypothetical protein [Tanacetum cinerariifolium]